jgi:hypothetical protein
MDPNAIYEEFEAERQPPYFSFDVVDTWYDITFVRELEPSKKFKLGDEPAKVWLVKNGTKEYRLTIKSARLNEALQWARKKVGNLTGATLGFKAVLPEGSRDDKDRTFRVRIPVQEQMRLGA